MTATERTSIDGTAAYIVALDKICSLANSTLYIYEKDFADLGFNTETRYNTLRQFLLANSYNQLHLLTQDTHYLASLCPRIMMLLRYFSHNMTIRHLPLHMHHLASPFAVVDNLHFVRRFHFDSMQGVFTTNEPQEARSLHAQFNEMWLSSRTTLSATTLGL